MCQRSAFAKKFATKYLAKDYPRFFARMSNGLINDQLDVYLCRVESLAEAFLNETATFNRLGKNPAYQDGLRKAGRFAICASIIAQRSGSTVSNAPLDTARMR